MCWNLGLLLIVLEFHCASPLGLCATCEARNRSKGCDSPNCCTVQIVAGDNLDRLFVTSAVQFVVGNLGTPTVQIVAKSHFSVFFPFMLLHLHEIVEGSYFHCSLSLCVCFCLCVCVSASEKNSSQMNAPI